MLEVGNQHSSESDSKVAGRNSTLCTEAESVVSCRPIESLEEAGKANFSFSARSSCDGALAGLPRMKSQNMTIIMMTPVVGKCRKGPSAFG